MPLDSVERRTNDSWNWTVKPPIVQETLTSRARLAKHGSWIRDKSQTERREKLLRIPSECQQAAKRWNNAVFGPHDYFEHLKGPLVLIQTEDEHATPTGIGESRQRLPQPAWQFAFGKLHFDARRVGF